MLKFSNPGEIDPRLITTLGVNVKEGESPIGFFGTGLKYAIAGLLREGRKIDIWSGLTHYTFRVEQTAIRGKEFGFIYMTRSDSNDRRNGYDFETGVALGFTTELGKQWEPWMFYRELASNVMDENGTIEQRATFEHQPRAGETVIYVTGLDDQYHARSDIFLQSKPIATIADWAELHAKSPSNGTNYLYYRGVRVATLNEPSLFNYNITHKLVLTEDRTVKSQWEADYYIANGIVSLDEDHKDELERILLASDGTFEHGMNLDLDLFNCKFMNLDLDLFNCKFFDATVERLMQKHLGRMNASAVAKIMRKRKAFGPTPATMSKTEQRQLDLAMTFLRNVLNIHITVPVHICDSLGDGVYGLATRGQIFVSRLAFSSGTKRVVAVLVEEYLHAERGLDDFRRDFQTWVLEKMIELGEEVQGRPL
jgi:hypothetical protein